MSTAPGEFRGLPLLCRRPRARYCAHPGRTPLFSTQTIIHLKLLSKPLSTTNNLNPNTQTPPIKQAENNTAFQQFRASLQNNARTRLFLIYLPLTAGILLLAGLLFVPSAEGNVPAITYFLGRFHPLIIHFPVVLIPLLLLFEVLARFSLIQIPAAVKSFVLILACVGTLLSIVAGFLLYYTGEYGGEIMALHKWGSIGVGMGVFLTALFYTIKLHASAEKYNTIYFTLLGSTTLLLGFASHQGGSLTHGKEYLTEYLPAWFADEQNVALKPLEEMLIYEDIVVPMLDAKCMSCHNENKTKGDLMMTTYEGMMAGGKGEMAAILPNDADNSNIYHRVMLPETDDEHMPPEGKAPLTHSEKFLLKWWIEKGASPTITVQEAEADSVTRDVLRNYLAELTTLQVRRQNRQQQQEALMQMASKLEKQLNVVIQPDPETRGAHIMVSMQFPPAVFGDNELAQLSPLFPKISKLSLVGSNITDDGLYHLGKMVNLKEVILQQTPVKGPGLAYLSQLPHLELLNVSKTEVDDAGLLHVLSMSSLKEVYLNQTKVSETLVKALQKNNPDLRIQLNRGEYF